VILPTHALANAEHLLHRPNEQRDY
jgi:hypothetical protein